jgi:predicted ATPase
VGWHLLRGELASARATAISFSWDAEKGASPTEAGAARRVLGQTCLWQGDFSEAQTHFEEALKIYDSERDREVKFRFGMDTAAGSKALLAIVKWLFGEAAQADQLIESAVTLAVEFDHVGSLAPILYHRAELEILRGHAAQALRSANTLLELSKERGMPLFLALGTMCHGWTRAGLGEREEGIAELQGGLTDYTEQGNKLFLPFLQGLLAELEAERLDQGAALTWIEEALAVANRTGEHWTDSFLHRVRGEILLKLDPVNTGPAEEAFLAAIAIALQQKAKSFELQAALALARLYQSIGRAADAHAVLAPALKGFFPTQEMPEIGEAQALLQVLEGDEAVKAEWAQRERRVKLQLAYGTALISARGYGAEETVKAFDRARELSAGVGAVVDRLALLYGTWLGTVTTESFEAASKAAAALLAEATEDLERCPSRPHKRLF